MVSRMWRTVPAVSLTVALATGLLAACNPAQNDEGDGNTEGGGKGLVLARTGDVDKLDPHLATAFQTIQTLGLVYDRLVTTDNDGKIIPGLAEKWEQSRRTARPSRSRCARRSSGTTATRSPPPT